MKQIYYILCAIPRAIRLASAQVRWQGEQEQFERQRQDKHLGVGFVQLVDRARRLGYANGNTLWELCVWACVSDDNLAGPKCVEGRQRAIREIEAVITRREREVAGRRRT